MTNQEEARALVIASLVTIGTLKVSEIDTAITDSGLESVVLGMLESCEELTSWVKNTSYQWHKAQSFVLHGWIYMKKAPKKFTDHFVGNQLELYVTPNTQTLKIFGSAFDLSIRASHQSSRVFLVLPSVFKLLAQETAIKEADKLKRMVLNTKLTDAEFITKVQAMMTLLNY